MAAQELGDRKLRVPHLRLIQPTPSQSAPLAAIPNPMGASTVPLGTVLLTPAPAAPNVKFSPELQHEFTADLVNVFSACGISYNTVTNPVFRNFFAKYFTGAQLPCRQVLSGRALDEQVTKAEASIQRAVKGKLAMGQCDGWKNVTRKAVVAVMMTVEGYVSAALRMNIGCDVI
jgi:hypothetical protein